MAGELGSPNSSQEGSWPLALGGVAGAVGQRDGCACACFWIQDIYLRS